MGNWAAWLITLLSAMRRLGSTDEGLALGPNSAFAALRRRYARGEISRDEYERVKRDLCE